MNSPYRAYDHDHRHNQPPNHIRRYYGLYDVAQWDVTAWATELPYRHMEARSVAHSVAHSVAYNEA